MKTSMNFKNLLSLSYLRKSNDILTLSSLLEDLENGQKYGPMDRMIWNLPLIEKRMKLSPSFHLISFLIVSFIEP